MWWLDSSDMVLVLGAIGGCTSALLLVFCQNMRKSRCTETNLCCGCIKCIREVETAEELAMDLAADNKRAPEPPRPRSNSSDEEAPVDRGQI